MPGRRISIITDFGCPRRCGYCVWREHRLAGVGGVAPRRAVLAALAANPCESVSVSGGGEPLLGASARRDWWEELLSDATNAGKAVHVHSREILPAWLRRRVAKLVFSSDAVGEIPVAQLRSLGSGGTAVRLAKVLLPGDGEAEVERYLALAERNGWQVTFKELMAGDVAAEGTRFADLERSYAGSYGGLRFLTGGDHNDYLMPDGRVYTRFRAFPEDRRTP